MADVATDLSAFGYKQELDRSLGNFSSFAAGFSYISILTGVIQLFAFGFLFAGPAVWWTWLIVLGGQSLVGGRRRLEAASGAVRGADERRLTCMLQPSPCEVSLRRPDAGFGPGDARVLQRGLRDQDVDGRLRSLQIGLGGRQPSPVIVVPDGSDHLALRNGFVILDRHGRDIAGDMRGNCNLVRPHIGIVGRLASDERQAGAAVGKKESTARTECGKKADYGGRTA